MLDFVFLSGFSLMSSILASNADISSLPGGFVLGVGSSGGVGYITQFNTLPCIVVNTSPGHTPRIIDITANGATTLYSRLVVSLAASITYGVTAPNTIRLYMYTP